MSKRSPEDILRFPTGVTVERVKKLARQRVRDEGVRHMHALEALAAENGVAKPWNEVIKSLQAIDDDPFSVLARYLVLAETAWATSISFSPGPDETATVRFVRDGVALGPVEAISRRDVDSLARLVFKDGHAGVRTGEVSLSTPDDRWPRSVVSARIAGALNADGLPFLTFSVAYTLDKALDPLGNLIELGLNPIQATRIADTAAKHRGLMIVSCQDDGQLDKLHLAAAHALTREHRTALGVSDSLDDELVKGVLHVDVTPQDSYVGAIRYCMSTDPDVLVLYRAYTTNVRELVLPALRQNRTVLLRQVATTDREAGSAVTSLLTAPMMSVSVLQWHLDNGRIDVTSSATSELKLEA